MDASMEKETLMNEIVRDMLQAAFERVGREIIKKHPEYSTEEMKAEASRMAAIYLENYDRESNVFDLGLIQQISGINFQAGPEPEA
jgi:predicted secreted Zn-dependent protease